MKAVRVMRHGPPLDVVEVGDIPIPDVPAGHVRVQVAAASLNFGDIARCKGGVASAMTPPPFTLGMDVCGVVESAGSGMEHWLGKRVVAITVQSFGGMAEYAVANILFDAPPELSDAEAAAFTLPFHTAYLGLHKRARLQAGETLLVVGGATSLGTAAIQLGVAAGARVIALAGGPAKGELCLELGAELAIDYDTDDVFDRVMAHTNGHGAEVVFDMIGGERTETMWTCVAHDGRYVPVGFNDDAQSGLTGKPLRKVSMGNFSVVGVILAYGPVPLAMRRFGINPFPSEVGSEVHGALRELIAAGVIRPTIGKQIPMSAVAQALDDHDQRRTSGRTVVDVAGS